MEIIGQTSAVGVQVSPSDSGNKFRAKRFSMFREMIDDVLREKGTCSILEVGGTEKYWQAFGSSLPAGLEIVLLNTDPVPRASNRIFRNQTGDACDMSEYPDNSFDLVHSNSVIEHVGPWARMAAMASEIQRVAPRYFVQTPNYWFPVEAHVRIPFFHWMPEPWRVSFMLRRGHGFWPRATDLGDAVSIVQSAVLLDFRQMSFLFPQAKIERERFIGLTKSLIAIKR